MMDINKNKVGPWVEILLILAACIAPSLAIAIPSSPGLAALPVASLITSAIQALSQTVFLIIIIGAKGKFREFGMQRPKTRDFIRAGACLAIFFAAGLLGSGIAALLGDSGVPAALATSTAESTLMSRILYIGVSLAFALAIGYREELIYRIYTITALRENGVAPIAAVVFSALLFTLGHAYQGAAGIIGSCALALALGALAVRGYGLHALAWGHAAYDFFVLMTRI